PYHGVFRSAAFGPGGPGGWETLYNGPLGDLRGTYPGHDIYQERVGGYVYAAASAGYGAGVWTDARDPAVCPAVRLPSRLRQHRHRVRHNGITESARPGRVHQRPPRAGPSGPAQELRDPDDGQIPLEGR